MRRFCIELLAAITMFSCACDYEAPYEIKINLDADSVAAHWGAIVGATVAKPRTSIYYLIDPPPTTDRTIVRARRDYKNKTDLDVKLRDISALLATHLSDPDKGLEDLDCEYDVNLLDEGDGKLSCDIKTKFSDDTTPLDGATTMSRLDEDQIELFEIGTRRSADQQTLTACPGVATQIYEDPIAIDGCDETTFEVWELGDELLYELSCKSPTLAPARAGMQATVDSIGLVPAADQRGKTTRALEICAEAAGQG